MAVKDLANDIKVRIAIDPAALAAGEVEYNSIDTVGSESVTFIVTSSGLDVPGIRSFKVQDSDDTLVWADVAIDQLIPSQPTFDISEESPTPEIISFGYVGARRYVRLVSLAGTPVATIISGTAVLSELLHNPAVIPV